jgi:probable F420-dependent oxidoreductase
MRVEAFASQTNWREVASAATEAETLGFDSFASPEIVGDPFVRLVVAAQATTRIQLRTAICVAFPRSPMVVANLAWELNVNSGGRFALGLGTQVKGHNERRFSVPWTSPGPRLREYVESLRAIWRAWEHKERLCYEGQHYQFTLMTPEFSPPPSGLPPVPVYIAAVRPHMIHLAGSLCEGVRLHGFCTRRYLEEVAVPGLASGLAEAGRDRKNFEVCGGGFLVTGPDADAVKKQLEWARYRIAFYASTRTYAPVLSLHGWDDLGEKLHLMSARGQWTEMAQAIPDDVLYEFCAVATYPELAKTIEGRFGGLSDTVELGFDASTPKGQVREILQDIQRIPRRFERHV